MGSYILDCHEPEHMWIIPCVPVSVVDPTGAGNAYAAALGYNLATLLPSEEPADSNASPTTPAASTLRGAASRREAVLQSACRASATGAAVVACEGVPVPSEQLETWLQASAVALRQQLRCVTLQRTSADSGMEASSPAALTPPPAPVKKRGKGRGGKLEGGQGKGAQEGAGGTSGTRGVAKDRSRGKGRRGGKAPRSGEENDM